MHDLINIITVLVFILLHLLVFVGTYELMGKRITQPAVLFSLVWLVIISLHFIFSFTILDQLYNLRIETYLVFLIGTVFFTTGSFLVNKFSEKRGLQKLHIQVPPWEISFLLRVIFTAIVLIGLPLYIQASFQIFLASKAEDFFSGLRSQISYADADIGPLKYLMPMAFATYAFNLYGYYCKKNGVNRILLIVVLISLTVYAVFATGRTYFFIILSIYLAISSFLNPRFSIKKYLVMFAFFLMLFILVGILYGKGADTEDSLKDNLQSSSEGIGIYMVSSLNALDMELTQGNAAVENGDNTLRFFTKLALSLGLIPNKKVNSYVQEYKFVPYSTNVYTFYSPYIRDFGKLYAWIMLGIFGALQTWLYNRALYFKSIRSMIYYSYLLAPLLLSFFADQYLTTFSYWLQIIVFTELFFVVNKIFVNKKW